MKSTWWGRKRFHCVSPHRRQKEELVRMIRETIQRSYTPDCLPSASSTIFGGDSLIQVRLVFCMRRPDSHFASSKPKRVKGLKAGFASPFSCNLKRDVDNMAKFIQDCLTGVAFDDDKQVISLEACKLYDCDDTCEGRTDILVRILTESEARQIVDGCYDRKQPR